MQCCTDPSKKGAGQSRRVETRFEVRYNAYLALDVRHNLRPHVTLYRLRVLERVNCLDTCTGTVQDLCIVDKVLKTSDSKDSDFFFTMSSQRLRVPLYLTPSTKISSSSEVTG